MNDQVLITPSRVALPFVHLPVSLRDEPLSLWYRFGIFDTRGALPGEPLAERRVLHDFCLHLQVEGTGWIWCEALGGSLSVEPGDVLFLPPGFIHAWAYTGEKHLAVHFDLQRDPDLTPHNYDNSYGMIQYLGSRVEPSPAGQVPLFLLQVPGQAPAEAWRIPLVTRLPNRGAWRSRLSELVKRWETRTLETVLSQLRTSGILAWLLADLTQHSDRNLHLLGAPGIRELLDRCRTPGVLAKAAACPVATLAQQLGMGETQFRTLFKSMTARTPHRYFREQQVRLASDLLRDTALTAKTVAETVGFDDPYHFSRVFRDITGLSPTRYRREMAAHTGGDRSAPA